MSNEYVNSLNNKSAWVFTKQAASFDEAFKVARLFADVRDKAGNYQELFEKHYEDYGIATNNYRKTVIPQLFGLITKAPFYTKKSRYKTERPTEIFDLIKDCDIGDELYNRIKTEQLLKIKIHAIIDTENNNENYNVLPVLFIYKVLKKLKDEHGIDRISIGHLWTYVMTCKSYEQIDTAVELIRQNAPMSEYNFGGNSRILPVIEKNTELFIKKTDSIAINPIFDEYFNNNFAARFDFDALHEQLLRDVDYSYFLYNHQGFDINLIDVPKADEIFVPIKQVQTDDEDDERKYQEKVDSIKESNINEDVANAAHKTAPAVALKTKTTARFDRNPLLGKIAIKRADYLCELNHGHQTFISKRTGKPYMESHHFIPIVFQEEMWNKYRINIDCVESLISLCPTCHKAFHYGTNEMKEKMIEMLFEKIVHKYTAIGFGIGIDEVKRCYGL